MSRTVTPADQPSPEVELLKVPQFARALNLSRTSAYKVIKQHRVRTVTLLGSTRVPRSELRRLLAELGAL